MQTVLPIITEIILVGLSLIILSGLFFSALAIAAKHYDSFDQIRSLQPIKKNLFYIILAILFGSVLTIIALPLYAITKTLFGSVFLLLIALILYGNQIERFKLIVYHRKIQTKNVNAKFIVISDLHLGTFKDQIWLETVVNQINNINEIDENDKKQPIDFVLIAGDFTLDAKINELEKLFKPLEKLKLPIYGTIGNHDLQRPGMNYGTSLTDALSRLNVRLIDNQTVTLNTNKDSRDSFINLIGIPDNEATRDASNIKSLKLDQFNLILAHEPDSVRYYDKGIDKNANPISDYEILTIAGHTHGGQIRLPFIYKYFLPVKDNYFDRWFYKLDKQTNSYKPISLEINHQTNQHAQINTNSPLLYISQGVGEVGLPIRLFCKPSIDIIELISVQEL